MTLVVQQNLDEVELRRKVEETRESITKRAAELCEQGLRGPLSFWPWRSGRSRQSLRVVPATSKVADEGTAYDVRSNVPYARWINRAGTASPHSNRPNLNRYVVGTTLQALWPQIIAQLGGVASYDAQTTGPAPLALNAGPQPQEKPEQNLEDALSSLFGSGFKLKDVLGDARTRKRYARRIYRGSQHERAQKNRLARERYKRRAEEYDRLVWLGERTGGILAPRYTDRPGRSKTGRQAIRGRVGGDDLIDAALIKRRVDRKLHRPLRPARRYLRRHEKTRKALKYVANLNDKQVNAITERVTKPIPFVIPGQTGPVRGVTRAAGPSEATAGVLQLNENAVKQLRESARVARRHINRA